MVVQLMLCASWLLFLFYFVAFMTPTLGSMSYDIENRDFDYGESGFLTDALMFFDDKVSSVFPLLTVVIYFVIILLLIRRVYPLATFKLQCPCVLRDVAMAKIQP